MPTTNAIRNKVTRNKTATIQFRVDPIVKKQAIKIFKSNNVDLSLALQTFLQEVVEKKNNVSKVVLTENGFTPAAEKRFLDRMAKEDNSKTFLDIRSGLAYLKK